MIVNMKFLSIFWLLLLHGLVAFSQLDTFSISGIKTIILLDSSFTINSKWESGFLMNANYSRDGKLISDKYSYFNKTESFVFIHLYKYDNNKNLVEKTTLRGDSSLVERELATYNNRNNIISSQIVLENGEIRKKTQYKYDKSNTIQTIYTSYPGLSPNPSKKENQFNEFGLLIKTVEFDLEDTNRITEIENIKYNRNRRVNEIITKKYNTETKPLVFLDKYYYTKYNDLDSVSIYGNGELISKKRFVYHKRDASGHWLEGISMDNISGLNYLHKSSRKLIYY